MTIARRFGVVAFAIAVTTVVGVPYGLTPPAHADDTWIALAVSSSSLADNTAKGSTEEEATAKVMAWCQSRHPDCMFVVSGQQCVAEVQVNCQYYGGIGATESAASQAAMRFALAGEGTTARALA